MSEKECGNEPELPGCQTTADTVEELLKNLEEVKRDYILIKLDYNDPIAEPGVKEKNQGENEIKKTNSYPRREELSELLSKMGELALAEATVTGYIIYIDEKNRMVRKYRDGRIVVHQEENENREI